MTKITIGISVGRKYENYEKWLRQDPEVEIIKLGYEEKNFQAVSGCHGILLTGGEDVHPRLYNKPGYVEQYRLDDLDERRDEFELKILSYVHKRRLPLLGVCRGLQLTNVFLEGTLVPDIVAFGRSDHRKHQEGNDRQHPVWLKEDTLLGEITRETRGEVNSAHHQSIDLLGDGLSMSCVSPDGTLEGAEIRDKDNHPFLLLVQWHPERMPDQQSPFSRNIREAFLESVRATL
ncbi:MAG: gamma-glutamyl-gamma-aminobutyrate hydrolase family protein [Cytophagales bacterium]|nr:gamma-glutamyl-gamma-aminobutyrate hydrolase family protein [Cytophagales bacterium]